MKKLLLLEPDEPTRQATTKLLELAGYTVLTAVNGISGIERALTEHPDLILSEVELPLLAGHGVLQVVKQTPQLSFIPFLFLTARATYEDLRHGMELGADDYLTKPCDSSRLLQAVAARLDRFRRLFPSLSFAGNALTAEQVDNQYADTFLPLLAGRKGYPVSRGQYIYVEGDEPNRLYFVESGCIKTTKSTDAGKELITGFYRTGEFFGHKALLGHTPYYDSAVATEPTTLLHIPMSEFVELLVHNPLFIQTIIQRLTNRLREREQQLVEMAYGSLRSRVAAALLRLHARQNTPIALSRDELAAVVGTAPESMSRIMSEFRQSGLIEIGPHGIQLLNPDKLLNAGW